VAGCQEGSEGCHHSRGAAQGAVEEVAEPRDQKEDSPRPDVASHEGRGTLLEIVRRTAGVSAAFIKELMRRIVQFHIERNGDSEINRADVDLALDEMLFSGGSLNLKLLGAGSVEAQRQAAAND